jgi:hypothetical protein
MLVVCNFTGGKTLLAIKLVPFVWRTEARRMISQWRRANPYSHLEMARARCRLLRYFDEEIDPAVASSSGLTTRELPVAFSLAQADSVFDRDRFQADRHVNDVHVNKRYLQILPAR